MKINTSTSILIWPFIFPLVFDIKTDENGDHSWQIVLVALAIFSGGCLLAIAPRFRANLQLKKFVSSALYVTLLGSLFTQFAIQNDFANYLRVLLPYVLFFLAYKVGVSAWHPGRRKLIEDTLVNAMYLSLVFTLVAGLLAGGPIDQVRYHVVSPVFLGLQGFLLHEIIVARRVKLMYVAVLVLSIAIELLSVTRSLLIGTVGLFLFAIWMASPNVLRFARSVLRATLIAAIIGAVAGGTAVLASPNLADMWEQRIFLFQQDKNGIDPTTLTRVAEAQNQYDQVTSSLSSTVIGEGYGHPYRYAQEYISELAPYLGQARLDAMSVWEGGHNLWVYQLFAGGILFGLAFPGALLYGCYRCARSYKRSYRSAVATQFMRNSGRHLIMLVGFILTTIGGNPMGQRFSGLAYGLSMGLMVADHCRGIIASRTDAALNRESQTTSIHTFNHQELHSEI
ncbi:MULTISPECIES: hypothetical protein [Paraburkholderia]|uniref:O-antigen ligase domain-containing protein n=1 Tax=Paraburkholderia madseniana TaxID=2599607 RepID=A0AAP5BI77_9BURK|nr:MULTISPECIES: hypothetical protein [Paraburkholderia]MCX4149419.1 hypothetical protein [Paraburkholderia madseniana]MDN7152354.1 hypothetical protein [Paraburkholderia sp. WS6]MDQ6411236.1 hypothetical protein [Paraburkholderia madseniana]